MNKIEKVLLGSDIEFFLQEKETGKVVSAEGYVKGTKHRPFNFDKSDRFWATSLDNVAYEGNIPPANDPLIWRNNIQRLIDYINSTLPENLCTLAVPSHDFDPIYLNTPNARRFGCDSSYCVWTRSVNEAPDNRTNTRSTGMHIHASWNDGEMEMEEMEEWVKAMDLHLGIASVLIEPENKRRSLYGKAGEFRMGDKHDRVEYRSLSSYFASSAELTDYAWNQTFKAIDYVNNGNIIDLQSPLAAEIIQAINTSDKKIAQKIVDQYEIEIPV